VPWSRTFPVLGVNPRQIYAEGHSSGAVMAARLACDAPTVFASVAGYGGGDPTLIRTSCDPERPIVVGLFQDNADPISTLPSAIQHRDHWLQRNGCLLTPTTEPGVEVEASTYAHAGRAWKSYGACTRAGISGPAAPTTPTSPNACETSSSAIHSRRAR